MICYDNFKDFIDHICEFKQSVVQCFNDGKTIKGFRDYVYSFKLANKYKNAVWEYVWSDITYDQLLILLIENKKI